MSVELRNKELRAEIKKLSEHLGVEVKLASSRAGLLEQLDLLRSALARRVVPPESPEGHAPSADTSSDTSAGEPPRDAPPAAEATAEGPSLRASGYIVAPGRSLTTKRGLLGPGERVPTDGISHERLERLVEKGVLVRV